MRSVIATFAVTSLIGSVVPTMAGEPKTEDEKTLYAVGIAVGRNLMPFTFTKKELEMVQAGIEDSVLNKKPLVDLSTFGPKIQDLREKRVTAAADKEKKSSKSYLEKAATEKGAVKSESGLIYIPLVEGNGESPKATDTVKVHYHGTLTNGTVFDSSIKRGAPVSFPLNSVIPCWTEGVQKMKIGGKAKLVCPSEIAYGDNGRPPQIAPGATLVFEVELLEKM